MLFRSLAPKAFSGSEFFDNELGHLAGWVKSSRTRPGVEGILLPGEPESQAHDKRLQSGIQIDQNTWDRIGAIAKRCQVPVPEC